MKPLNALASLVPVATFHATRDGEIIDANAPFVQLMRCVPGDDWRLHVVDGDRTLLDTFWKDIFTKTAELHQPIAFLVRGSEVSYQIRAQAVSDHTGNYVSAVGAIVVHESASKQRWQIDEATGLPEHNAVIERFDELMKNDRPFMAAVVLLDETEVTDELLRKEATRQLLSVVRPTDMLASEADGHFLLCAGGVRSPQAALALAERLVASLKDASINSRAGVALPDRDIATATLVREASAGAYASEPGSFGFAPAED